MIPNACPIPLTSAILGSQGHQSPTGWCTSQSNKKILKSKQMLFFSSPYLAEPILLTKGEGIKLTVSIMLIKKKNPLCL